MASPQPALHRSPGLRSCLEQAFQVALGEPTGTVASYIPELSKVDPELCGLALCTVDGEVLCAGDAHHEFTLQSVSKPLVYGWALDRLGRDAVHARVGVEPTGDAFDSMIRLERSTLRPHNPMVNAGAIAVTGLLLEQGGMSDPIGELLHMFGAWAGRTLSGVDVPVYLSERSTGYRNQAIAYLMRHCGMLRLPVEAALDLYFQQCSVLVTSQDLAVAAATLANQGKNPLTGEQVIAPAGVEHVLTVMFTCGLYDDAGRFAFEVGLPAKSGVSGALLVVVPGQLGCGVFSPRLDARGHSVRGLTAVRHLSRELGWHVFDAPVLAAASPAVRPALARRNPDLPTILTQIHQDVRPDISGAVATYIPQLAQTSPAWWALAVCPLAGEEVVVGDADVPFTLQSAANPFTYSLAAERCGPERVHQRVGVEPSDNPFDAIVFDPRTQKPWNPLSNAGAIAVCGLIPGENPTARLGVLLDHFAALAGEPRLHLDAAVLQAEKTAGDRNRALAALLRNFGLVDDEHAALELYFQQCSIKVTCRLLARMGATLANGGVRPGGRRVLAHDRVRDILSLMLTCGLHDESGQFAFDVGLPAKTGISGAIVAVVPGRMGIAAYSPRVNRHGSSVRGVQALKALAACLRLGIFARDYGITGLDCTPALDFRLPESHTP